MSTAARLRALLVAVLLLVGAFGVPAAAAAPRFSVLVFSKTTNFRHESIEAGNAAIKKLGEQNNFAVEATEDAAAFTDTNLARFAAIIFNNTNSTPQSGDLLNAEQRAAFQRYIQRGGGWTGIHAATASERDWKWFEGLAGAIFDFHPVIQPGRVKVLDHAHPSTQALPDLWELEGEEWYNWKINPTGKVHTLAQIKLRDGIEGLNQGVDHPVTWCQNYDGGRSWYTTIGHGIPRYSDPAYLKHILGGIEWSAGAKQGDCSATKDNMFQKVPLITEGLADPFELAVAPDRRVFYIQRTGALKILDQRTLKISTALDFAYTPQMTSQSDGLLGLALDNNFAQNNWIYLLYSDKVEKRQNLSRFTVVGDKVDMASEKRLLEVPTFRDEFRANSHMGGSIQFDKHGNLYIATGDNTDPFNSDGYAPIDERPGRRALDAQGTAGNTNDFRGKVLRITPQPNGTYTIPPGNLFPPGTEKTKPEIYVMGMRNPFRITVDPATDALMVADYGPDARSANPNRGPEGTVEFARIPKASNQGWPYCIGNNTPFNDYDFATGTSGPKFDCANLVNDSPNNTGLRNLPKADPPTIWYAYSASAEFPELGTGGGGPMSGPVYSYDPANPLVTKFPEYYDGKWFGFELTRGYFKAFSLQRQDQAFNNPRFPAVRQGDLQSINKVFTNTSWTQAFSAHMGPDGSMYVIDFGSGSGTGRGGTNDGSGIYRIDYVANGRRPIAKLRTDVDSGRYPLTVKFSSAGSAGGDGEPIDYSWDFDGNGTIDSTEANPTHTYETPGQFDARLSVKSRKNNLDGIAATVITAGNTRPEVKIVTPQNGGFFEWGDTIPFEIRVTDREDGRIDCTKVVVQSQLGHDAHLHPMDNVTGCRGEFKTDQGASHGPGQNLYVGMAVQYADGGGARSVPSLTGSARLVLEPKRKEAEHYEEIGGAQGGPVVISNTGASAGKRLGEIEHGDWVAYDPVNLTKINSVTVGAASGGLGGKIEFRADSPTGQLLGSVTIPDTGGFGNVISPTVPLANPGRTVKLYAVFTNPAWSPDKADLLSLDWLQFNGEGMTKPGTSAGIVITATPATGTAPLNVSLSSAVTPPPGRTITGYSWDFGDNTAAGTGASVTHQYARKGVYTARLTTTDSAGVHSTNTVSITAD
ncbi:glucose/arabinose dehydrogenase/PKD repeat protein/type 1 glutamine amidotransferase [Kibdelosporangium banguiense]|uniref:Glucose/arabinose dehydrogenase/PKD repeat protein/type 1 glutamine amidotransferase n=1 Tax=Kibdelosporangium banguiense TaxID=1365924 RepID=A0ABS4T603_9PSEU|nr:ThuA domain-containing protein [Kibdelosporangium banguiense]MBP2319893.1 glucose/arabinose dehydrogenase/PKD repeat protein/type 1 glutamine amidotransferase [Kibdelosporangium banguiense]